MAKAQRGRQVKKTGTLHDSRQNTGDFEPDPFDDDLPVIGAQQVSQVCEAGSEIG